jgi:hypothetical protein
VQPAPVSSNPFSAGWLRRGGRQIGQADTLPIAAALAHSLDAAVIVHLDGDHRNFDTEDLGRKRQGEILLRKSHTDAIEDRRFAEAVYRAAIAEGSRKGFPTKTRLAARALTGDVAKTACVGANIYFRAARHDR